MQLRKLPIPAFSSFLHRRLASTSVQSSSSKSKSKKKYSSTVLLPHTSFPRHIAEGDARVQYDESIKKSTDFDNLYSKLLSQRNEAAEFILHDGPPYANGDVHIGHAVNKILKDITHRYKILRGFKPNYIPGWDCHGLPIELKALERLGVESRSVDPASIRGAAETIVRESIEKQRDAFRRWGILADWKQTTYRTTDFIYEAKQVDLFWQLYQLEYIYRDKKPVYWSPASQSSLAEAELEYNESHRSAAAYVAFKLRDGLEDILPSPSREVARYAVIWTTTPWSIPGNQAIAFNPDFTYLAVMERDSPEKRIFLLAKDCFGEISKLLTSELTVVSEFSGKEFLRATYEHPLYDNRSCRFVPATHVSATKGSGLVHTAPAHGQDDFLAGRKHNLDTSTCHVDHDGKFADSVDIQELIGKEVLKDGTAEVLSILRRKNLLLHVDENFIHSYPYDWRTKTPVILRASDQWFIDVDKLKADSAAALENVRFLPGDNGKQRMMSLLMSRPYWCISRQRSWGVPIPVFYTETMKPLLNESSIGHIRNLFAKEGSYSWSTSSMEKLFPEFVRNSFGMSANEPVQKGMDILDIWFESGTSWACVIGDGKVSDVVIEGHDQYGAWFQTSLLTSVALRKQAPYKTVYVHGFTVDEEGRKMSKSVGNVVHPDSVCKRYGMDVLRLWVAQHAPGASSIHFGDTIIAGVNEELGRIRNTFRFLLGSLNDFSTEKALKHSELLIIDKMILGSLADLERRTDDFYSDMLYNKVVQELLHFVNTLVSSFYCTIIKDRLYCEGQSSIERLSAQTTVFLVLSSLSKIMAPIMPHFAEEIRAHLPGEKRENSVMFEKWNVPSETTGQEELDLILKIRDEIYKVVGSENPLNFKASVDATEPVLERLKLPEMGTIKFPGCSQLHDVFGVSDLQFHRLEATADGPTDQFVVSVEKADDKLRPCSRCRKRNVYDGVELCQRCLNVIGEACVR